MQKQLPEAHISSAGRGKTEQELYFSRGTSKAKYGQSAHNYNLALDIFRLTLAGAEWRSQWYISEIKPLVDGHNECAETSFKINWYGKTGSKFLEYPHCEVLNWQEFKNKKLVE